MAKRRRDVVVVVATAAEAAVVVVVASSGVVVTGVVASAFVAAGGMPVVDVGVAVAVVVVVAVGRRTGASVLLGVHRMRVVPADLDGVAAPRPKRRRMQGLWILKNGKGRKNSEYKVA